MAFEERFDAFDREERAIRARVGQDKHNLVYHIFTGCQMISCKYKYLSGLRGGAAGLGRGRVEHQKRPVRPRTSRPRTSPFILYEIRAAEIVKGLTYHKYLLG